MRKEIAVFGGSEVSNKVYQDAYEIGKLLASHGSNIITGGYSGVMEAVSKGANDGYTLINITGVVLPIKPKGNQFLKNTIIAKGEDLEQQFLWRVRRLMAADGYVFLPGSEGTVYELHTVMQLRLVKSKLLSQQANRFKPIILHSELGYWLEIIRAQNNKGVPDYMKDNVHFTMTLDDFKSHIPL